MNYFTLEFDPENMGTIPQGEDIPRPYDSEHPHSFYKTKFSTDFHKLIIPSKNFKIKYHAKWTDVLSIVNVSHPYLIVSQNFKYVILKFNIPEHYFFSILVEKNKQVREYFIFVTKDHFPQYINFETSTTELVKRLPGTYNFERIPISFNSIEDFQQQKLILDKQNDFIQIKEFDLNRDIIDFDLFRLPFEAQVVNYIVNEQFAQAVISAKLTGIKFVPFPPPHRLAEHNISG